MLGDLLPEMYVFGFSETMRTCCLFAAEGLEILRVCLKGTHLVATDVVKRDAALLSTGSRGVYRHCVSLSIVRCRPFILLAGFRPISSNIFSAVDSLQMVDGCLLPCSKYFR